MESIMKEFKSLEIQLQEIISATNNFDRNKIIGCGGFGDVYEGEMSHSKGRSMVAIKRLVRRHGQGEPEFLKEISTLSRYSHKNIITLLGFCDHGDEKILVYEHAARGSLDHHLSSPALTWTQRIKICLDAAKGLAYLHNPRKTHQRVLHRDIKSSNILLDADWNAKISDMGLSKIGPAKQLHSALFTGVAGTLGYCDPQYLKTYTLTKESDIYSYGVVLFEVLCGKLCYQKTNQIKILVPEWKQSYQEMKLDAIIFQHLVQPMDSNSLKIFSDIAFQCLQKSDKRPTMSFIVDRLKLALKFQKPHDLTLQNEEITPLTNYMKVKKLLLPKQGPQINLSFMKPLQHLKVRLEEIKSATNNFDVKNVIGAGPYYEVYKGKGEVSHRKGRSMVAFMRLSGKKYEVNPLFWEKIMTHSCYMHQNVITLLGICTEDSEAILVYEDSAYGNLDLHLSSPALTWTRRIKICLDAAKGIGYLLDHRRETYFSSYSHGDIKSSSILLDANWNAKVSDMILSELLVSEFITLITEIAGRFLGYLDPSFLKTGVQTKESDIYSFGVVLLEVLCGRLCFDNGMRINLVPKWKQSYKDRELDKIIFEDVVQPMDPTSLKIFSDIAFQCVKSSREKRPTITLVVEELELALAHQERHDLELQEYEEILKAAVVSPLRYRSLVEMKQLLANGIYLYGEKRWVSLNENGNYFEVISIAECLDPVSVEHYNFQYSPDYNSRFPVGCYETYGKKFKTHVKTQLLSPLITYTVNIIFKFKYGKKESKQQYIALKYKLEGETKTSISYLADEREDEWLIAELYQLANNNTTIDLKIIFEDNNEWLLVDGIEFQPVKKVEHEVSEYNKNVDLQIMSDQDTYWEQKLPDDYEQIIEWAKDGVKWTTKKELYSILCNGLLINEGQEWFFLDKHGKKCVMLSPRVARVIGGRNPTCESSHESRFGEALQIEYDYILNLHGDIESCLVSPDTSYASYLVYKLPEDQIKCDAPVEVRFGDILGPVDQNKGASWYIFLASPITPVIARGKVDRNIYNPLNRPKIDGIPHERSDNWMEVQVWKFRTTTTTEKIHMNLSLTSRSPLWLHGLIVQGIEFRPI